MPCTTILVGKKVSNDGSTIIGRNDDGSFETKKVVIVKPEEQPRKYKCVISHLEIDLPDNPLKYSAIPNIDLKNGLWSACGINSLNVAMTATETLTSNPRVMGADPYVEYKKEEKVNENNEKVTIETPGGIGEEDLLVITLPYITCAKDGVKRVGELLEKYGTYEPNGMAFSDENEIWWLETIGGHHWIAKRVPDDHVVVMPNYFGLDTFDLEDALGEQKEHMCSSDLKEFIEQNHLALDMNEKFNPRLAFGSHSDADHVYNSPRAWYIERYFNPTKHKWDGENAEYTPESNNIPWAIIPESKVTVQDVKYALSSYYQGTKYNPYSKYEEKGKYRPVGVPNTDDCAICQIRNGVCEELKGVEWITLGGGTFTGVIPFYTNVDKLPAYLSQTTETVDTNYFYWHSRIIEALTDAHYGNAVVFSERYQNAVLNGGHRLLHEYDAKISAAASKEEKQKLMDEANENLIALLKKESDKALGILLEFASNHMKTRYYRSDN